MEGPWDEKSVDYGDVPLYLRSNQQINPKNWPKCIKWAFRMMSDQLDKLAKRIWQDIKTVILFLMLNIIILKIISFFPLTVIE